MKPNILNIVLSIFAAAIGSYLIVKGYANESWFIIVTGAVCLVGGIGFIYSEFQDKA